MTVGIRYWLPLAVVITALSGLIYLTAQQNLRQNANDPQIQISEDIADHLSNNPTLPLQSSSNKIDLARSLSTYIIIFTDQGKAVFSTGELDGQIPTLPSGVLDHTKSIHQDRITWQPKPGVRSAVVITRYSGNKNSGFVLVGRSLREVEIREDQLTQRVGFAWAATIAASFIATSLFVGQNKKRK